MDGKVKIFYINNGMTHYYNQILSRLNKVPGIELILIVPDRISKNIQEGVYQTTEGADFRVVRLAESNCLGIYSSFRGLAKLLLQEKPDVIIVSGLHILLFVFNVPICIIMRLLRIKLIMRSIPFRTLTYKEAKLTLKDNKGGILGIPDPINAVLIKSGIFKLLKKIGLSIIKKSYNMPDAHVNYVDKAFDIYGSYGVPKEKIFIIRNSPDTDMLFAVKESLKSMPAILPACEHRLIHVGRLVEWKRVDLLLRAFARVKSRFKDAELIIIGTGPQEMTLKALSVELGIDGDVKFIGGIYDPKLLGQYLMSSSIYVLAGMGGLSINDAMCFGLPIICSVCDGTEKILVRDEVNGKYFCEGDENDLVEKITYLFSNPELRKKMGNNSTEIIRNEVNIHTVIKGYQDALEYVFSGKRRLP